MAVTTETIEIRLGSTRRLDDLEARLNAIEVAANAAEDAISRMTDGLKADIGSFRQLQNRIKELDQVRQASQSQLNDTSPGSRPSARQRRTLQRRIETSATEIDRLEGERRQTGTSIRERRALQRQARSDAKGLRDRRKRIFDEYDGFFNDEIDKFTQSENRAVDQLSASARRARTARTQDLFRARQTDLRKMGREAAAGGKRLNEQNSRLNETADALQEQMAQLERYQDSIAAFRDRIVRTGNQLLRRPGISGERQSRINARIKEVEGAFAAESAEIQRTRQALTTQLSSVLQQRRGLNTVGKGRSVVADRAATVRDRAARLRDEAGISAGQLRVGIRVNGRTSRVTPANAAARAVLLANKDDNIDGAKAILDLVDRRLKRLEREVKTRDRLSEASTTRQATLDRLNRTDENFRTANATGARVGKFRELLRELNAFTGSRSGFNNLAKLVKEAAQAVTIPAGFKTRAGARSKVTGEAFETGSPTNINALESAELRLTQARRRADLLRDSGVSKEQMSAIDSSISRLTSARDSNRFAGPLGFDSQFMNLRRRLSIAERSVGGEDATARTSKKISDREVESRKVTERLGNFKLRGAGGIPEFAAIQKRSEELSSLLDKRQFVDFDRVLKVVKADLDKVSGQLQERERLIKQGNNRIKAIDSALRKGGGFAPGEAAAYFGASFNPGVAGGGRPGLPARNQLLLPPGNPYLPAFRPTEGVSSRMGQLPPTMLNGVPVPRIVDRIGNIRTQDQTDFAFRSTVAAQDSLREADRQNQQVLKSNQKRTAEEVKSAQSLAKQRDMENNALNKNIRSFRYFNEILRDLTPVVDNQSNTFQAFKSKVGELSGAIINRDSRLFKSTSLDAAAELASLRREIRSGRAGEAATNARATAKRNLSRSLFDITALEDQLVSNPRLTEARTLFGKAEKAFTEGRLGELGRLQKDLTDQISRAQRIAAAPDPRERLNSLVSSGLTFRELLSQAGKSGAPAKSVADLSGSLGNILEVVTREGYALSGQDLKLLESRVKAAREFLRTQNAIVAGKKQEVSLESQRQRKLDKENERKLGLQDIESQFTRLGKAGAKGTAMDALRGNVDTLRGTNEILAEPGQGSYFDRAIKAARFNAREARAQLREISGFTKERQKILSGVGSTGTKLFSLFGDGGVTGDEYKAIRGQLIDIAKNARTGAKDADALSSALGSVQRRIERLTSTRSGELKFGERFSSELQNLEKSQGKLRELQLDSATASELRRRNSELITKAQRGELAVNSENLGVIEQQIAATNRLVAVQNRGRKVRASRVDRDTAQAELELLQGKKTGIELAGADTQSDIFKSFQSNMARLETMITRPRIMARDYNPLITRINKQFSAISKSVANTGAKGRQSIADSEGIQLVERLRGAQADLNALQQKGVNVTERLKSVTEAITRATDAGFRANEKSLKLLREELRLTEQLKSRQRSAARNAFDETGAGINLNRAQSRIKALEDFKVENVKLIKARSLLNELTTANANRDKVGFSKALANVNAELQNLEGQYGVQQKLSAIEEKRLNSLSRSEKIYKQIEARIGSIASSEFSKANMKAIGLDRDTTLKELRSFIDNREFGNFNRKLDTLNPMLDDLEKATGLRAKLFADRRKAKRPLDENRKALENLIEQRFQTPDDPQIKSLRLILNDQMQARRQGRLDLFNSLNLDFRDRISAINRTNTATTPQQVRQELRSRLEAARLDLENVQGRRIMVNTPQGRTEGSIDETDRITRLSNIIKQIDAFAPNQGIAASGIRVITNELNAAADRLTVARKQIRNAAASGQGGAGAKPLDPTVAAKKLDGLQRQAQVREQELLMLKRKGVKVDETLLPLQAALNSSKQQGLTITRETLASLGAQINAAGQLIASEEKLKKLRQQDAAMRRFDDTANSGRFAGQRVAPALQRDTLTSMLARLKNTDTEAKVFRGGRSMEEALSDAIGGFNASLSPRPLRDASGKIAMSARGFEANGIGVAGPNFGIPQGVAARAGETAASVISTFADKLTSGAGRSAQAATKFASAATKAINKVFGRNSPPKFIVTLIEDIILATTSGLENGTGAIKAAFSKAFKGGADAAKQALADLSRAPVQKAPLFTGQLGETSERATRMAGFVARTSVNPRRFRPLANLAGDEILDSQALTTAAQRRFYERIGLGPRPATVYTNPEIRRNVRGTEGVPGAGLEQQIVEAAMSRVSSTGAFISPIERSSLRGIGGQSMINPGISMDRDGGILTGSPRARGDSGPIPLFAVQEARQEARQLQQSVTQFTAGLDAIGSIIKATSSKIGVAASKMAGSVGAVAQPQARALPAAPPPPPPLMRATQAPPPPPPLSMALESAAAKASASPPPLTRATQAPPPPPPLTRATQAPPLPPPLEPAAGTPSKSAPSTISADQRRRFDEAARIAAEIDAANAAKAAQARAFQAPFQKSIKEAARLDEEARRKQVFDSFAAQRAAADLDAATAKKLTSPPPQPTGARRVGNTLFMPEPSIPISASGILPAFYEPAIGNSIGNGNSRRIKRVEQRAIDEYFDIPYQTREKYPGYRPVGFTPYVPSGAFRTTRLRSPLEGVSSAGEPLSSGTTPTSAGGRLSLGAAFTSAIADLLNKVTQAVKSAGDSLAGAGGGGRSKASANVLTQFSTTLSDARARARATDAGGDGRGSGGGGGPRPPASSSGSNPDNGDLGRLANQNRGNLQALLGLKDLANTSRASANSLTQFSAMLSEARAGARATDKGFRETARVIRKVNDRLSRLDPNADFLTRKLGSQKAQGLSEGLIGGAFPLLFGQGVGASIGGGVGGFLGGNMGGMLGFGMSLVGTAIGTAVDTLIQNTQNTGNALRGLARDVSGSFEQIKEAGLFASSAQERFVQSLIESGKVATAYAVIQDRVTQRLGIDGADRLKQAAEAGDRLNRAMNDLGVQLQLFISGPLASFLEIMAGALTQGRRVSTTGEAFDRLSPNKQKQFLDELAKANIAAGADPAKSGFIYRSVPGGAQLFSGEGKAEDKADTFKRLTSNLAPAQIQRIFAGLNPSGNKPKPLSNQEKADLAVNTAQENLTNAQALLDRVSKRNESNDILKGFKQRNLAAKREQEDLDRQSFELRRDYEKSIGDIRRGVEERIGQIQQENRQKEIEGVVKQGEIRQQQLSNSAAAIRGGLAGDQIASDLADAVTSFLSAQLSAENQLQQRRMQFEAEVANLQLETEKYKIDVARSVAQLNLNTAERIQQINRGVARRNEDAATNVFNSEKEVAALRNDVLLNELLLMRAKRLVFLEQAKVNLQADPGNPNLRLVKEAEETIIKDYDKYVDRVGEIGKSIKTMSPPPRIREVPAATTRGVSFSGVDRVANRRRQILEENMRREEELTALIKEGSKTELANRLTSGVADVRNEMSTPMTDALKSLQGATGSTRAAIQEITNSYGKLIASLASDPKIVLSAELSKLIAVSLTAREALEGLRPTYEYYTSTFGDLASKTSQVRQEISDLLSPTTEYERILKRINESGGLSAGLGEERNKELLDAAKYVDTLDKVAKFLSGLNDIAGGITDSFINFNKELFKGANLMESVAAFAEEVADKTLDVILEFTLRPIQEQLFKNMTNLLGIEAPQDPILLPLSKINTGVDSLVREAEKGFLIREPSRPGPVVAPTPGGAAAPLPPGLAPLPSGSRSSLPLGTVIGAVAGNPAQHTGMGGPGATTPQNVSPAARIQALLDMISYAEGTFRDGGRGYNIRLGGSTFDNSRPHPGTVISSGQWSSNAHGAYQFLSPTWKGVNQGQNRPMTPENQDKAAINLIQNRGVNPSAPLTQQAIARLAPEWASLPTMGGASYYGQPVKRLPDLLEFYNRRLELHNSQVAAQPAPAAPTSEQMQQRGLQAMEDFYGIVQRAGQELAKLTDGLSGIRIATEDTTVKAAEGAEKLNNSVNAFQRTTQIGLQAMSSIAMSIGGAQLIGRGGAYNVLMGAASIFGSISSITGMFGAGGSLEGVFGKKPPAAPVAGARRFGGPVFAGSQYLVGENGPELFTPSIGGTIVDNDELYVPGLDDKDSPSPSIGRYSRQGSSDTSMNNLTVPYQRNEASREIDRLEQVASNPRELPPIKYETTRINEYEFVTPEQLEASNARTAKAARNQTIRELADSMKTRKRLGIA